MLGLVLPLTLVHLPHNLHTTYLSSLFVANFTLPEVGSLFDSVEFTELNQEEGGKLVEKYMKEAKAALPPPEKRFRGDRFSK